MNLVLATLNFLIPKIAALISFIKKKFFKPKVNIDFEKLKESLIASISVEKLRHVQLCNDSDSMRKFIVVTKSNGEITIDNVVFPIDAFQSHPIWIYEPSTINIKVDSQNFSFDLPDGGYLYQIIVDSNNNVQLNKVLSSEAEKNDSLTKTMLAIKDRKLEIIKQEVSKKPEIVNECEPNGRSILGFAAGEGFIEAFDLIFAHCPKGSNKINDYALTVSSEMGHIEIVKILLNNGAKLTAFDDNGVNGLHYAIHNGHFDVAKILIENGCELNALTNSGASALMFAIVKKNVELIELLLEHGTDINIGKQDTVLGLAILSGNDDIMKTIVKYMPDKSNIRPSYYQDEDAQA